MKFQRKSLDSVQGFCWCPGHRLGIESEPNLPCPNMSLQYVISIHAHPAELIRKYQVVISSLHCIKNATAYAKPIALRKRYKSRMSNHI